MSPGFDPVLQAALFILCLFWCVFVLRRLPADLAELSRTHKKFRVSRDSHLLGAIKEAHGRRERYRQDCARDFWITLAVQVLFFWPATALAIVVIGWLLWGLCSKIAAGI